MDANNTGYHLFMTRRDWSFCADASDVARLGHTIKEAGKPRRVPEDTDWNNQQGALTLKPVDADFPNAPGDQPPADLDRRGAARDRFDNWYWLDGNKTAIRILNAGTNHASHFWRKGDGTSPVTAHLDDTFSARTPASPVKPTLLSGLTVTDDHYLVVGTQQPAGILVFDLHAGGAPSHIAFPVSAGINPFDMTARPGGGLFVLDRVNKRVWGLDSNFNFVARAAPIITADNVTFTPKDGSAHSAPFTLARIDGLEDSAALSLDGIDPLAIQVLPDCTLLILYNKSVDNKETAHVQRFSFERGKMGEPATLGNIQLAYCAGHDFAFVPEYQDAAGGTPDLLFVALNTGNQAVALEISLADGNVDQIELQANRRFYPMRLYSGRGIVGAGRYAYYDSGERWLPLIAMSRPRYAEETTFYTYALDGREPDCRWHRLLLDGCIPPGTSVEIESSAHNDPASLDHSGSWQHEPDFYLRSDGSELPYTQPIATDKQAGSGTWELLFQAAEGRYLQLKITLRGDGRSTPRIHALRAYYPRFSYRDNYLPGVYRDRNMIDRNAPMSSDCPSGPEFSFLDRLLANFEGIFTTIEDRIAAVQILLDPRTAPSEALEWLASWFDVVLDSSWSENTRRLFIRHAMDLFQYRGTRHGIIMALRLALDECVDDSVFELHPARPSQQRAAARYRILEKFRGRRATTPQAFAETAHRFSVSLPVTSGGDVNLPEEQRRMELMGRIVALEKPAHTIFDLKFHWALFRVGEAHLGDDTIVDRGGRSPQLMKPMLLDNSYLVESYLAAGHPQNSSRMVLAGG